MYIGAEGVICGRVHEQDWACLLVACVFNAFSSAGWNALDTLSSESFPLQIRTTSLGILRCVLPRRCSETCCISTGPGL